MKQLTFALTSAGTACFIIGLAGLFVANAPVVKSLPQRQTEIKTAANLIGLSGGLCALAAFPVLMTRKPEA